MITIPLLEIDQWGKKGVVGWFFLEKDVGKLYPLFQCPHCNEKASFYLHSIDTEGQVTASVLCQCNKYHEFVKLENWPSKYIKRVNKLFVETRRE